jgi:hypothetical protein
MQTKHKKRRYQAQQLHQLPKSTQFANADYIRNVIRSARSAEQVMGEFFKILWKYRRAVLNDDPAGIRAFGEELNAFGGKWAMKVGFWTTPMPRLRSDIDPRLIRHTLFREWRGFKW